MKLNNHILKKCIYVLALILISVLLIKCDSNTEKIKVGYAVGYSNIPLHIADKKGYFKEENLDVELIPMNPRLMLPAFHRGDLDFAGLAVMAGLINAKNQGLKFHIVADLAQSEPDLLIRKDLWDNGIIKDLKDLKNKTVRVAKQGSGSYFCLGYMCSQA